MVAAVSFDTGTGAIARRTSAFNTSVTVAMPSNVPCSTIGNAPRWSIARRPATSVSESSGCAVWSGVLIARRTAIAHHDILQCEFFERRRVPRA